MDISASKILPIDNLSEYKIHFAVWNGEEQPLDVFVRDPDEWKGWNSWRGSRNDFSRKYIFSLIRYYHQSDKWLFGGIFEVTHRNSESYTVKLCDLHHEYIGRLLLNYPGPGVRGRAFYLENHFNELKIAQLFEKTFEGEAFCGYENVEHGFSQIEAIIKQSKPDWKAALENVKGVYLIVDKSNGKKYVGSAYGDTGIWSRWASYISTGHGGNEELTKLINAYGFEHARTNFQFSILEFRSMRTDDETIRNREQYWKRALQTNAFGYNRN
ncbi:GIY-YIG nuclease family protein [Aeromonas rivipollensis]|uniref:GIY-YIG nuclease family protein n=1 Tax=Aeromonas rivipollensis TaxID=948519 RepID=UPI0038D03589